MGAVHRIRTEDREYDSYITLWGFDEEGIGEFIIGAVEYLWGIDGSEVCELSQAIKVTTDDGKEIWLTSEHTLRQEITECSLWREIE